MLTAGQGWRRAAAAVLTALAGSAGLAFGAAPARAAGTICVGVVVDYGAARPGGGANSACVRVPVGASGADVLATRARTLGRPAPTYRSDGLLCTIDGYPNDGTCANSVPGGFRYWSYWHLPVGSSSWVYSRAGATMYTVSAGTVEGWAFQNGGAEAGRHPATTTYAAVCASATPSPGPTTTSPAPAPRPTPGAGSPTPTPTRSPDRASGGTAGVNRSAAAAATVGSGGPAGAVGTQPRAGVTASIGPASAAAPPPPSAAGGAGRPANPSAGAITPLGPIAGVPTGHRSGGLPVPTVAGVLLAAVLAGAAVVRARR